MSSHAPITASWLVALALAAGATPQPLAPAGSEGVTALAQTWLGASGDEREDALERLQEFGVSVAPELLTFLGSLPPARDAAELDALLRQWSASELVESVLRSPDVSDDLSSQLRTVRRLGVLAVPEGLEPLLRTAGEIQEDDRRHPIVRREVQDSLAGLLRETPEAARALERALDDLPADMEIVVVRAIEKSPNDGSYDALVRFLGRSSALDAVVLEALGRLEGWHTDVADGTCAERLTDYLGSFDVKTRRAAVIALGRIGATRSLRELIDMSDDTDRQVRSSVFWALQQLSGLGFGDDAERWRRWFASEAEWFRSEAPRHLADARGSDPARAFAALREIAQHRSFAEDLIPELASAVRHPDANVARTACETVVRLGTPAATRVLATALDDRRDIVRDAAMGALDRLGAPTEGR